MLIIKRKRTSLMRFSKKAENDIKNLRFVTCSDTPALSNIIKYFTKLEHDLDSSIWDSATLPVTLLKAKYATNQLKRLDKKQKIDRVFYVNSLKQNIYVLLQIVEHLER